MSVPWYDADADGSSREPKGVKAIEIPDVVDVGAPGLKYATPDVSKESIAELLSLPEIHLFANSDHMDMLSRKKFSRAWTEKVAADGEPAPDGLVVDVRNPLVLVRIIGFSVFIASSHVSNGFQITSKILMVK